MRIGIAYERERKWSTMVGLMSNSKMTPARMSSMAPGL